MPQPLDETRVLPWVITLFSASIATWVYLFAAWRSYGVVLPYKRRQPVPWGAWATGLAVLIVVSKLVGSTMLIEEQPQDAQEVTSRLTSGAAAQLLLCGLFVFIVIIVAKATRADLGVPHANRQALQDALIGFLACLAAYVPVSLVRMIVIYQFGQPELHPTIQDILKQRDTLTFTIAFVSVVIIGPICEEVIFRLLLQGWLEKWEDRMLGWRVEPAPQPVGAELAAEAPPAAEDARMPGPPVVGLAGPYGALPVLVSSTMFAWAHIGHSTDPFPLFVLALFLGFVYQRTHRILPCIVAHAAFNLISMLMLLRILLAG
jgi:membrane protease YdiL (CAAX protease family)